MRTVLSFAGFATLMALGAQGARAESLNPFIGNASFESPSSPPSGCCASPIDDWSSGGPGAGGVGDFNPSTWTGLFSAYSGNQVAYVNNSTQFVDGNQYVSLFQTLNAVTLHQGNAYTLTYAVTYRSDLTTPFEFRVQINGNYSPACVTCYSITSGSTSNLIQNTWKLFSTTYVAQAADEGTHPTIYLVNDGIIGSGGGVAQAEFDISPTPEAASIILVGIGFAGVLLFRGRLGLLPLT